MANQVLESFENTDGRYCVDIFQRADGSFGFEEFRRDAEDGGCWQNLHKYGQRPYATGQAALESAMEHIDWLEKDKVWRW